MEIESKYRNQFVQDLITQNIRYPEEIYRRAEVYGWDMRKERAAMIIDIDNYKQEYRKLSKCNEEFYYTLESLRERIFNLSKKVIDIHLNNTIFATFSDYIVLLIKFDDRFSLNENNIKLFNIAKEIKQRISNNFPFTVTIGISNYKNPTTSAYKSYQEAKRVINVKQTTNTVNSVTFYKDLGIYELLSEIGSLKEVINFSNKALTPLIEYDDSNNSRLVETLSNIVECDWNLKKTSTVMFVHYNTIKYRYKIIQDILGEDFSNIDIKLKFSISTKLKQINTYN